MCGRFSLGTNASTLASQFNLFEAPVWTPRYNIAPTQEVLTVLRISDATSPPRRLFSPLSDSSLNCERDVIQPKGGCLSVVLHHSHEHLESLPLERGDVERLLYIAL